MIEVIAFEVASVINENSVWPKIRYSGKFSMLKRKMVEKTTVRTTIISSGLSTDHKMPRALRRYLSLKSLETREVMVNQFLLALALNSGFGM